MGIIYKKLEQAYNLESGVCVIAAPTGSGKTHSVKELAFNKIVKHIESSKAQKNNKNNSGQLSLFEPFFELTDKEYTETNCPTIVYLADKKIRYLKFTLKQRKKLAKSILKERKRYCSAKPK